MYEMLDHNIRPLFFIAFVPAAISVFLVAFVHEAPHRPPTHAESKIAGGPLPTRYWRVVAFLAVFGVVNFSDALLILRAKELGLGFAAVILVYVLYNLTYAGLSYPAGHVSDRVPRRLVVATGLAIFAVAYLGLGITTTSAWVWPLFALYGGFTALTDGVGKAWVADLVPADREGSGLGFYQGIAGAGSLVAGVWAGLAWNDTGRLPLIISGSVATVLSIMLFAAGRRLEHA